MRADYLSIPPAYADRLGGLRWSDSGDAVEYASGKTFALAQEVRAFVQGYASQRPLVHFGHILHLMYLIRAGQTDRRDFTALNRAWQEAGRPARTAGVLAAVLSREVPSHPAAPPCRDSFALEALFQVRVFHPDEVIVPEPPLDVETFEAFVGVELAGLSQRQVVHWLRYGEAPVDDEGRGLAEELLDAKPRSLAHALAEVSKHERLAASVPLVARLVGALSLPPRRLTDPELPLGGYSDVTTRGQPEQILPAQFALDELEFLRRHAERELLYYRREEPSAQTREELVVLADQGVRTWGKVRLVLGACVFALGELAQRRKLALRIATTGNGGRLVDPCAVAPGELADLLAGSDLSAAPALALETVLGQPCDRPRDVVLLTHPRGLADADVAAAARRLPAACRLFAVAAQPDGQVEFSELRRGLPVALSRFRLDLDAPAAPAPALRSPAAGWTGDVEPVGFPFRFGLGSTHERLLCEFDPAGEWLLVPAPGGLLLALRTDGSGHEMLPRPLFGGQIVTEVHEVVGVPGGFAVLGAVPGAYVLAHYLLRDRTCRVYDFRAPPGAPGDVEWRYLATLDTMILRVGEQFRTVHLATGSRDRPLAPELRWQRRQSANPRECLPLPYREVVVAGGKPRWAEPVLTFHSANGTLGVVFPWGKSHVLTPLANGEPTLAGLTLMRADCRHQALAALFTRPGTYQEALWLFDVPRERAVAWLALPYEHDAFALSPNGRLVAVQRGASQVQVREVAPGLELRCATPVGKFHNNVAVELGEKALVITISQTAHVVRWESGALAAYVLQAGSVKLDGPRARALPGRVPGFLRHDRGRFRMAAWHNLIAVVSAYGEVFLFEHSGELVCAFFAFRQLLAAWMPDGTRLGPASLTGAPPSADAGRRIGQALLAAWERGERTAT
jgi:hypothetical protein